MDQESRMLILYWFCIGCLHTDWDDESDAKPKMLILYWFGLFCAVELGSKCATDVDKEHLIFAIALLFVHKTCTIKRI